MAVIRLCCVFLLLLRLGWCFNHWVVTEDGKIEYQVKVLVRRGNSDRLVVKKGLSVLF